ncbi:MAG: P-II family nitrogen regulator [Magnetococcales bacterium]|nr:P-II family nitrogen regulator [Magnetococcales bacterium]NGZ26416.1 P-II family nitrogen regulator [Magnetococcales bacterium]
MSYQLVVAMVRTDLTEAVVKAAKQAGATGATIVPARGTGIHEAKTFFGLSLEPPRDVILILLPDELVTPVLAVLQEAGNFAQPGTGIALTLSVGQVIGLESQLVHLQSDRVAAPADTVQA